MERELYQAIYKRKSFHLFRNAGSENLTPEELAQIEHAFASFERLYPDVKTAIRIVPAKRVNLKRDAEYCVLIYSEKRENYLMNVGYVGEQLDLYLVEHQIGTLWFGIGKPDEESFEGLNFVIMIAIRKISDDSLYRKDMFRAKRKPLSEIWTGPTMNVAEIARFAPSACNTQPWFVRNEGEKLTVFRYKKPGKRGIMPAAAVAYYNRIDVGIFLCFLELCMAKNEISAERTLFPDNGADDAEYVKIAEYALRA